MRNIYLLIAMLVFCSVQLKAQPDPPSTVNSAVFGQVEKKQLQMSRYPPFSESPVVILNDIGEASIQMIKSKRQVRYRYHRRIKYFQAGPEAWTEVRIPFDLKQVNLMDFRAATYNLNAEGKPTAFEVVRRNFEIAKLGGSQRELRFRFPLVQEGSVAEYFVEFTSNRFDLLRPWVFQQKWPVALSEFHLLIPSNYTYQVVPQGDTRNMLRLEKSFAYDAPSQLDRTITGSIGPSAAQIDTWSDVSGDHQIFVMERVPALADEGFGGNNQNLLPGLRFQLASSPDRAARVEGVFDRWEQLERHMGRKLKRRRIKTDEDWIAAKVQRLTQRVSGQADKVKAIFGWTRRNLEWDSTYSIWPTRLDRLAEGQPGNGSALNLTLMLLLREAGLDAHPVLISTQEHGPIQMVAANLNQFNHLIVGINLGNDEVLLDALSDLDELGVLPRNDLNQMGYWLSEASSRWVRLSSRNRMVRFTYSRFSLSQEGWLTGDIEVTNQDYSAALERQRLSEVTEAQADGYLRRSILTGMADPRILDYQIDQEANQGKAVQVSCELQTQDFVEKVADLIFIKPMMTKMMSENPFQEPDRSTPIDLNYPIRESHLLGLRIPPGYKIEQVPEPIRVVMPGNAGEFVFNVLEMDDIVHVSSSILVNQTVFLPSEYLGIRTFFDYIVRKHQEDIVLKRIDED